MESFCFTFMLIVLLFKTFFWIGVFFTFVLIFGFTIFVSTCTGMLVLFFPVFPVSVPVSSSLLKSNIFPMFGPKSSIQIRIQTKRNKVFLSYLSKIQSDRSFSFLCFSLPRLLFWSHSLLVEFLFSYLCQIIQVSQSRLIRLAMECLKLCRVSNTQNTFKHKGQNTFNVSLFYSSMSLKSDVIVSSVIPTIVIRIDQICLK